MQNRWEAETQQRGADAAKAQVSKSVPAGRARDRWGGSNESQPSSIDKQPRRFPLKMHSNDHSELLCRT